MISANTVMRHCADSDFAEQPIEQKQEAVSDEKAKAEASVEREQKSGGT